jgi:hypothetical protein
MLAISTGAEECKSLILGWVGWRRHSHQRILSHGQNLDQNMLPGSWVQSYMKERSDQPQLEKG